MIDQDLSREYMDESRENTILISLFCTIFGCILENFHKDNVLYLETSYYDILLLGLEILC